MTYGGSTIRQDASLPSGLRFDAVVAVDAAGVAGDAIDPGRASLRCTSAAVPIGSRTTRGEHQ